MTADYASAFSPGRLILASDLHTTGAVRAAAQSLAAIEDDCSKSWPMCPRNDLICDCCLRAVRAINAVDLWTAIPPSQRRVRCGTCRDFPDGHREQCPECGAFYGVEDMCPGCGVSPSDAPLDQHEAGCPKRRPNEDSRNGSSGVGE